MIFQLQTKTQMLQQSYVLLEPLQKPKEKDALY